MHNFWENRSVFVTGATGLVGSWLVKDLIEKQAKVVVLVRDNDPQSELIRSFLINETTVVNGSLEDMSSLERAIVENEVDTVFHLGAQTIVGSALRSPLATFEANIRGTYQLLEVCRRHPQLTKRIVFASSDKAYGSSAILPYTEDMPLKSEHPYDVSKSCSDLIAQTYFHTYGLPIAIARCGNIYGGGDLNWSRIIPGTIRSTLANLAPIIRSNGLFTRDYVYVKDVVRAYLCLAEQIENKLVVGQGFNFGPNKPYTVIEIVNAILKEMNATHLVPQIQNQAKAEIQDQTLSSEKAARLLNWKPEFSLEEGLKETISWYEEYLLKTSKRGLQLV
jgi:Nucleoside-diphosphate-sugar epimerases